jgi:hypothetical protein
MRQPPRVSDAEKDEAISRIQRRHADDDLSYQYLLSDDPLEALSYLRRRGRQGLRGDPDGQGHDVIDALTLRVWLWWRLEEHELYLLDQVDALGLNRRRVGARLGVTTGQGLVDRREYKRGLLADPNRPARQEVATQTDRRSSQQRWLDRQRNAIHSLAATLVEHGDLAGDDEEVADWLPEVREDLRTGACTPASFTLIGWAVDALAAVPAIRALPPAHPLRQALGAWPSLTAAFSAAAGTAEQSPPGRV